MTNSEKMCLTNIVYLENQDLEDNGLQLYEFINCSDALISDYSSVAIDYLLLNRPIGFTLDDYDAYTESRGWVFEDPLEYMPGEHIYNVQQFEQFVLDVKNGKDDYENQRKVILAKTHNVTDNYCKRVLVISKLRYNRENTKAFFTCFRLSRKRRKPLQGWYHNMKICIWITKIFDLGGTKRVVSLLANELVKEHEVTIMTYEDRFREDRTMYHLSEDINVDFIDNSQFVNKHHTPAFCARYLVKKLNDRSGLFNKKSHESHSCRSNFSPKNKRKMGGIFQFPGL